MESKEFQFKPMIRQRNKFSRFGHILLKKLISYMIYPSTTSASTTNSMYVYFNTSLDVFRFIQIIN